MHRLALTGGDTPRCPQRTQRRPDLPLGGRPGRALPGPLPVRAGGGGGPGRAGAGRGRIATGGATATATACGSCWLPRSSAGGPRLPRSRVRTREQSLDGTAAAPVPGPDNGLSGSASAVTCARGPSGQGAGEGSGIRERDGRTGRAGEIPSVAGSRSPVLHVGLVRTQTCAVCRPWPGPRRRGRMRRRQRPARRLPRQRGLIGRIDGGHRQRHRRCHGEGRAVSPSTPQLAVRARAATGQLRLTGRRSACAVDAGHPHTWPADRHRQGCVRT